MAVQPESLTLVQAAQRGDDSAFELLLEPLLDHGYRLACAMLHDHSAAEDAVQEAAFRAWQKVDQLRDPADMRPWFLTIVANQCRTQKRSRWWAVVRGDTPEPIEAAPDDVLLEGLELRKALRSMAEHKRLVLVLHWYLAVFGTRDGGKTWQSSRVIVDVPTGYDVGSLQLGFLDGQSGWLWVLMETKSFDPGFGPFTESYLLSTSDGGLSWRMVSKISASIFQAHTSSNCGVYLFQMTFSSAKVGWIAPGTVVSGSPPTPCVTPATVVTRDGGSTWKPQTQPGSCNCWTGVPTFVDELHGFWQIASPGPNSSLSLMSTSDGGLTWRSLPPPPSSDFLLGVTPQDAEDLWALVAPPGWTKGPKASPNTARWPLYHSSDGGETWTLVGGGVPVSRGWIVLFADANHGMVVQVGGVVGSPQTLLAVTSDGGSTWKIVTPSLQT